MAGVPGPGGDQFNWDHYTAAASNPVQDDALASIHQWYRQYLGRDASDAEAQSWANNPNGIGTVEQAIANSPEAKARAPQGAAGGGDAQSGRQTRPSAAEPSPSRDCRGRKVDLNGYPE